MASTFHSRWLEFGHETRGDGTDKTAKSPLTPPSVSFVSPPKGLFQDKTTLYSKPRILGRGRVHWLAGHGFMVVSDSGAGLAILVKAAKTIMREKALLPLP